MEHHPASWPRVIERFSDVDDEYIFERVLLAAYGSLLRADNRSATAEAAHMIWRKIFAERPPLNSLVRDHARCVIEMALRHGPLPSEIDVERCRPPYSSIFPSQLVAPKKRPSRQNASTGTSQKQSPALSAVERSVLSDDFATYTMPSALSTNRRPTLNLDSAKRWIVDEVQRLGFDKSFDRYDSYVLAEYGGGRGHPAWAERIGKKYQWIALYRLTGLVSDHIPIEHTRWDPPSQESPIPLQSPGERNLDPTILLRRVVTARTSSWWAPEHPNFRSDLNEEEWLDELVFPDSAALIDVTESSTGRRWLSLQTWGHWDSRSNSDNEELNASYRDCFMQIRAYLVTQADQERFWRWLRKQDLHGRWMPEGARWLSYVFAGEYPWSVQAQRALPSDSELSHTDKVPVKILPATHDQTLEFEFDAYHDAHINVLLPHAHFFDNELHWDNLGGYRDSRGRAVFKMPNLSSPGPAALLVDPEWLDGWLKRHNLAIFWAALSENHFIPGTFARHDLGYAVHSRAHRLVGGRVKSSEPIAYRRRSR